MAELWGAGALFDRWATGPLGGSVQPISVASLQYVEVPVPISPHDPTADVVKMGFLPEGTAGVPATWYTASWAVGANVPTVLCLVGPSPGVVTMVPGIFQPYLKITDSPEVPVLAAQGTVTFF